MKATVWLSLACFVVTASAAYGVGHYWVKYRTIAEEGTVSCDMNHLYLALHDYHDAKKAWPATLEDLKVDEILLKDRISGKRYLYFPDARYGTRDLLLAQPQPFRLGLWPFGETKRTILRASRTETVRQLYGQEAISLSVKGLDAAR